MRTVWLKTSNFNLLKLYKNKSYLNSLIYFYIWCAWTFYPRLVCLFHFSLKFQRCVCLISKDSLVSVCVCVNVLLKFCFPCRKTLKAEMCVCLDTLTEISRHQRSPAVCVVLWLTEELGCHSLQHQLQKLTTHWVSLAGNFCPSARDVSVHRKEFQLMSPWFISGYSRRTLISLYLSIRDWMIRKIGTAWKTRASEDFCWKICFRFMYTDVCAAPLGYWGEFPFCVDITNSIVIQFNLCKLGDTSLSKDESS